uniref:Uncharacterized protein n=1 Tax=Steinernema glaseri TaxID=37863 RepID=A0A1I8AAZ8_9BILA
MIGPELVSLQKLPVPEDRASRIKKKSSRRFRVTSTPFIRLPYPSTDLSGTKIPKGDLLSVALFARQSTDPRSLVKLQHKKNTNIPNVTRETEEDRAYST